jgi:lipoprotein NlpD
VSAVVLAAILLAACTASWQAPVESRVRDPVKTRPARPSIQSPIYRVQRGDTLHGIAWQRGVDYRLIAAWNGIRPPYRIYTGQTLRLTPPPVARVPPVSSPRKSAKSPSVAPARKPQSPKTAKKLPPTPQAKAVSKPEPKSSPASVRRLTWQWPAQGRLMSGFKAGDPLRKGIKIGGRSGDIIKAAEGGKVVYSGSGLIGYGRLIIVKHNENYLSAYGHNSRLLVKEGDQVTKGQKIAVMGTANTGDPLLHFEIRRDGKPVDPLRLLPRR